MRRLSLLCLFLFFGVLPAHAATLANGPYVLMNKNSELCVAEKATAQGSAIIQTTCDGGGADQVWNLSNDGNGYAHLTNTASGLVLDISGYSTANGAKADIWPWGGATHLNQELLFVANGDGSYGIKIALSGKCLEDNSYNTSVGLQLDQWTCAPMQTNDSWILTSQGNTPAENGQCGPANGEAASSAPSGGLCSSGTTSAVSGSGPWSWSCAGSGGGTTASCSAPVASGGGSGTGGGTTSSNIPAGWPADFVIGLGMWQPNTQFSYIDGSGLKLGAVYEYLSGGINSGWQSWGNGFVSNVIAQDRQRGYLPIFTYYMLVGSPPNGNDGSPQTDLNTQSTMSAYWADFTTLLKQLKTAGGAVVVQIEPDMWGYLERANGGLGASALAAGSGNADLAGIPNTVAGLGQAYIHLRDLYAPNVVLASTVSAWSWSTNTNCSANIVTIGKTDAAFMSGTGKWDLYFTDVAFGDYGYGNGSVRWDPNNQTCPNFNTLNTWAKEFTNDTGKPLVLWQTPEGNESLSNTAWHYKDTRLAYWLSGYPSDGHLAALAASGVIGILFDGGEPSPTTPYRASGGSGPDDGGYLATLSTRYYSSGGLALH